MKSFVTLLVILFHAALIAQTTSKILFNSDHLKKKNHSQNIYFEMHSIGDLSTGYTLQSNASPQQLWYDLPTGTLNTVFTTSQQQSGWSDRTCSYFYSNDKGLTWTHVTDLPSGVPPGTVSGFPAILGSSNSKIVIANHTNLNGSPTRAHLYVNSAPGEDDFMSFDPGVPPQGLPLWANLGKTNNDLIFLATYAGINTFDLNSGTFGGYTLPLNTSHEGYSLSNSEGGKLGIAWIDEEGGAWFIQTTDEGLTWEPPTRIFEPTPVSLTGDSIYRGTIRGINLTYLNESPKVVFEIFGRDKNFISYYPSFPVEIYFWSPDLNGGNPFIIADSSNIPFYEPLNPSHATGSLNRPVIGKDENDNALFVALYAASEHLGSTSQPIRLMEGYFMMSLDGGQSWSEPARFTPDHNPSSPIDWRYVSIAPMNPVYDDKVTVHLVMQGELALAPPIALPAKFYHFSAELSLSSVDDAEGLVNSYQLYQNYPNPFNPVTTIGYQIPDAGYVTLKVYDVLGKEVVILINEEIPAGRHKVVFGASHLPSGVYFYRLQAGSFSLTKKMISIK